MLDKPFHKIAPLKKNLKVDSVKQSAANSVFFGEKNSAQLDQLRAHPDVFSGGQCGELPWKGQKLC